MRRQIDLACRLLGTSKEYGPADNECERKVEVEARSEEKNQEAVSRIAPDRLMQL